MTDTMPAQTQRTIDLDKLMSFVFRAVDEVGATLNTATVVIVDAARRLGVGTAEYRAVRSREELHAALDEIGAPAILKTARMGYDGKGQATLRDAAEADAAWDALSASADDFILEARVPFRMEVSVVCARSASGQVAVVREFLLSP